MNPPLPPLPPLRLATPNDIPRLSIIATSSFIYSQIFNYVRPRHAQFPSDTLLSYAHKFTSFLRDSSSIVLVALDRYDSTEAEISKAILPIPLENGLNWQTPSEGEEVVVGVAVWKLEAGSRRAGTFHGDAGLEPSHSSPLPENLNRDSDMSRTQAFWTLAREAEKKYFHGTSTLELLAVHPAYWRSGHGSALVGWGVRLAEMDGVSQGVLAGELGKKVYERAGFEVVGEVRVEGDERTPEGVGCVAMLYTPQASESGRGKAGVRMCVVSVNL